MKIRRVVTGHRNGKSTIVGDDRVEAVDAGGGHLGATMWGADSPATYPDDRSQPAYGTVFPPVGGFRVVMGTTPPGEGTEGYVYAGGTGMSPEAAAAVGAHITFGKGHPAMHGHDTTDVIFVIEGRLSMRTEDGTEVHLEPGDWIVQNGTQHAWINYGTVPVRTIGVIFGAKGPNGV